MSGGKYQHCVMSNGRWRSVYWLRTVPTYYAAVYLVHLALTFSPNPNPDLWPFVLLTFCYSRPQKRSCKVWFLYAFLFPRQNPVDDEQTDRQTHGHQTRLVVRPLGQPRNNNVSIGMFSEKVKGKAKNLVLVIALLTQVRLVTRSALQSQKWQLIDMSSWQLCRSALCGHLLLASANNWTPSLQLADIPPPPGSLESFKID